MKQYNFEFNQDSINCAAELFYNEEAKQIVIVAEYGIGSQHIDENMYAVTLKDVKIDVTFEGTDLGHEDDLQRVEMVYNINHNKDRDCFYQELIKLSNGKYAFDVIKNNGYTESFIVSMILNDFLKEFI